MYPDTARDGDDDPGEDATAIACATIDLTSDQRLLGSHPTATVALRPRDDDDEPDEPDDEEDPPPPPPPPVSVPDMAVVVKDPRTTPSVCLAPDQRAQLVAAARAALASKFPDADVRATCLPAGQPAGDANAIGIWTRPAGSAAASAARDRGLAGLGSILERNEAMACFINASFVRRMAADAFAAMPKRFDGDGNPDGGGPVHINDLAVTFRPPSSVVTTIKGYDERPWPDVDFTLTITDVVGTHNLVLSCETERYLDTDRSWLVLLTTVLGIGTVLTGGYLLPAMLFFVFEGALVAAADPPEKSGIGRAVLELFPGEIPIAGGQKLTFLYNRMNVRPGGLLAGGVAVAVARTPSVLINGSANIVGNIPDGAAAELFHAVGTDLRAPLTYAWSADGTVADARARATSISFSLGGAISGELLQRQVSVIVTDADGLVATATRTIRVHVTNVDDDEIPPLCRARPWLCEEPV